MTQMPPLRGHPNPHTGILQKKKKKKKWLKSSQNSRTN